MNLNTTVKNMVLDRLSPDRGSETESLNDTLRLLSKWRSVLIQNTYLEMEGSSVYSGPLVGLNFVTQSSEGCHIAKLLGTYEQPLHPHLEELTRGKYEKIINIGCAEGYYAVGLTKCFPDAVSLAYDTDPKARQQCKKLAAMNNVDERVNVLSKFSTDDFEQFKQTRVLVFCDIEGGEEKLFHKKTALALSRADIIVESHECFYPGITNTLVSRFQDTHKITVIKDNGFRNLCEMPSWFQNMSHLDQLLSIWEWRSGPTPWILMQSKYYA